MPAAVWLNGEFVERDAARVSAFDAGFQHAVGLFETMLAVGGRVHRLDEHLTRLIASARALALAQSMRHEPLAQAVRRTVERSALPRARVRLTVTGGDLNLLEARRAQPAHPTILISAQPATAYPEEMFERGVLATIADDRANPLDSFAGHKTLNYWPRLRALQLAAGKGAGETIVLQVTNHVAGGAVSNLFAVRGGTLVTPTARGEEEPGAVASPVLPGVARATVIDLADRAGVGCARRLVTVEDVLDADEVFLTNSSWGVLPVTRVEGKAIGAGAPGPVTRDLLERWRADAGMAGA
ncbi:MAG: hypothetical protein D6693_04700 [Planctomycetota bacterium]|nr:MAG: hypothetical protein D6693_04700 [Planctomycetota bacterium]